MGAAGALLQVGPLIIYFVKKMFFGNTPREAFEATFLMPSFDFGIMLPRMSLLATIGFAYSIVSYVDLCFFLFHRIQAYISYPLDLSSTPWLSLRLRYSG
jgi:calcium permeable stress-gated cation channel